MKICYIAPVTSISKTMAEVAATQFLSTLTNIIYIGGFGMCGVVAFLRILRTYLKCKKINDFCEMRTVLRDCALGFLGLIAIPHFIRFVDVIMEFIF